MNIKNKIKKEFVWDPTAGQATKPLVFFNRTKSTILYYAHDANKNVTELVYNAVSSGMGVHYEYDVFGNIIVNQNYTMIGLQKLSDYNPFRFSSEYHDDELGLIYYNYRHYNPISGRWLSRDPIAEKGGINLYGMCKNDLINLIDKDGLWSFSFGLTLSAFAISGPTISFGITFSYSKSQGFSIGTYSSASGGIVSDVGASASIDISVNPSAEHISDNQGAFVFGGVSAGEVLTVSGGGSVGPLADCGAGSVTYTVGVGIATPSPIVVDAVATVGMTYVHEFWNSGSTSKRKINLESNYQIPVNLPNIETPSRNTGVHTK